MSKLIDTLIFWGMVLGFILIVVGVLAAILGLALGPFAILGYFALKIAHVVSGK